MADKEDKEKKGIRRVFTVLTSPIWVPIAAAGGLVTAPVEAVKKSMEEGEREGAAKGVGNLPGNVIGSVVTSPFEAIGKVGEAMWGKDK